MKKILYALILITLWSCSTTNNKSSTNNGVKTIEKERIKFHPDLISFYDDLRMLMNKNYYWVYNVFNENEFEDTRNDNFKDLALITKNNFEDFIEKNNFENINEFKNFFNQFKAVGKYKNKFDKKHQIELTKVEKILELIDNY
ncbi:hypothetical protein [Cellulophaga sp. Z1A5H]|uniref:hypothetical protein n=1 Tax=Cellulophaga sp. Z1A5H TaxID=2687291 RepID=UPI0013FD16CB|nr:hypothetical protein [Cellulophaga sp. Z1A5H]